MKNNDIPKDNEKQKTKKPQPKHLPDGKWVTEIINQ